MTADFAKLFRIEKNKLLPYKAFNALMITYVGLFLLTVLAISSLFIDNVWRNDAVSEVVGENLHYNIVWNSVTFFAGYFNFFLIFSVIMYCGNEYSYRTLRQNIIDGLSPEETVLAKLQIILALSLGSTLLVAIVCVYMELVLLGNLVLPLGIAYLGQYFVQIFSTLVMGLFVATLFRKTGIAILIFMAWWYVLDGGLLYFWVLPDPVAMLLPASNLKDIIHFPGLDEVLVKKDSEELLKSSEHYWGQFYVYPSYLRNAITAVAWDALFIFLTFRMVKKRDL